MNKLLELMRFILFAIAYPLMVIIEGLEQIERKKKLEEQ